MCTLMHSATLTWKVFSHFNILVVVSALCSTNYIIKHVKNVRLCSYKPYTPSNQTGYY